MQRTNNERSIASNGGDFFSLPTLSTLIFFFFCSPMQRAAFFWEEEKIVQIFL